MDDATDGRPAEAGLLGDRGYAAGCRRGAKREDLLHFLDRNGLSADVLAFGFRTSHSGLDPIGQADSLLLGERSEDPDNGVSKDACGVQVALGVGDEIDTGALEIMEVVDRGSGALARETIESPKDDDIEGALVRVLEKTLEAGAITAAAALRVGVLAGKRPLVQPDKGTRSQ